MKITIGMVSRLEEGKGQDTLIKATAILQKKIPNIKVMIVGEGDHRTKSALIDLISKHQLGKIVKLMGYKKDVYSLMRTFDVFVFPTRWELEGFGLVCLEAMLMGIPIVASNFGPVPEVVGDAGILVDPTPEAVAEGILGIIRNHKLARSLVKKGSLRVRKYFDIAKIAKLYEEI